MIVGFPLKGYAHKVNRVGASISPTRGALSLTF